MRSKSVLLVASAALFLGWLPLVIAHGDSMEMDTTGHLLAIVDPNDPSEIAHALPTYFRHGHFGSWLLAHTVLMVLAWVVVIPVAIMLSIARSRYHLPAQLLFHLFNSLGVFTGFVYNRSTPNLYENNAHHPIGWVVSSVTLAWTLMSFYVAYSEHRSSRRASLVHAQQATRQNMAHFDRLYGFNRESHSRFSGDSGQGTERNSASLLGSRQNSSESISRKDEAPMYDVDFDDNEAEKDQERQGFLGNNRVDRFISSSVRRFSTRRAFRVIRFLQIVLEKFLLLLGFLAITSGFIVNGGLFRDRQIYSGLAHFIKGGIFFWYGLLTLGRWMGAFSEFGWAWNIRPKYPVVAKWKSSVPSAEFTESFVIWLYGASNVFLEHLNNWSTEWSPVDFEHVSITILFFGGGLLGMLVESSWLRELTNTSVVVQKSKGEGLTSATRFCDERSSSAEELEQVWEQPQTDRIPLNPLPALTIMLLGMIMSGHTQESMVSTMMHAQWGALFSAFALARAATYIILYLKPPTSHFASRPPSELVAAFCLTSGGLMFMMSAADSVWAIESNELDAMTIFTITMGLSAVLLAWEIVTFAIKGWAMRKERTVAGQPLA